MTHEDVEGLRCQFRESLHLLQSLVGAAVIHEEERDRRVDGREGLRFAFLRSGTRSILAIVWPTPRLGESS